MTVYFNVWFWSSEVSTIALNDCYCVIELLKKGLYCLIQVLLDYWRRGYADLYYWTRAVLAYMTVIELLKKWSCWHTWLLLNYWRRGYVTIWLLLNYWRNGYADHHSYWTIEEGLCWLQYDCYYTIEVTKVRLLK